MNYNNQPCKSCGEIMHDGDDIVVCPVCATPQHRSCWMQNGHCINEELHASGYVWEKEKGCAVSIEEISSVSWLEIVLIFLLGLAITYITALSRNLEFLSILPEALLIISGVTALFLFIIYCSSKFGDRNKESKNKAEMFLKNRLELEENNED